MQAAEEGNRHISFISKSGVLHSSGKAEVLPRAWCFPLEGVFLCFAPPEVICVQGSECEKRGLRNGRLQGAVTYKESRAI